ncbi:uncharacterized protein LOC129284451 [Prosopis cineraria]|uniref:uncharacterized protein LOC129284451 n=1 Tax=Prosopis cineraria TaxID=364024 RepID=UPI002410AEDE|nr:uncharacterized protein LOC129284451 [Prosopis cineraria]
MQSIIILKLLEHVVLFLVSMAKSRKSKPKPSLLLCCFASFSHETNSMEESKFSWRRVRKKKSASKTVPLDGSLPDDNNERGAHRAHPRRKWRWKLFKSTWKSTSNTNQKPLMESQPPATNPQLPRQRPLMVPVTPNQTPPQTQNRERAQQNPENENGATRMASLQEEARGEISSTPAVLHTVSTPASKRGQSRPSSSMPRQSQTTLNRAVRSGNARKKYESYDPAFGLSAVLVTLVIMIVWGRLCAILCTSAWLYVFPRIRRTHGNDIIKNLNTESKDLDLDSEVYKKKVILKGLLERNHRARHENSGN